MRYVALLMGSIAVQLALGGIADAADPRAAELTYEPWTKTCLTEASCFVAAAARGQCAPSGGSISVSPQTSTRALLTANVGTRTMLEGTISLRIDQDEPMQIARTHCGSCFTASVCSRCVSFELCPDALGALPGPL